MWKLVTALALAIALGACDSDGRMQSSVERDEEEDEHHHASAPHNNPPH